MRLTLLCVGKLKSGPEVTLCADYIKRAKLAGKALGFRDVSIKEVASGGGKRAEGERLLAACPKGARVTRLDESGEDVGSVKFSQNLARLRDQSVADFVLVIGGAEGYSEEIRAAWPKQLRYGVQTWPHKFVRVMAAEQFYRATQIEAGTPYHKA